ncbi:oligosaccharide flippase family protein [Shewanella insulae]|uniref:oligosaccharide flippase family protein n=1 Tax=Shewanella insulae TaxID=2681496 RepID=UPI001EFE5A92|nr:oligosaccharide flippase family protein [Shewanella insulae]MCG9737533.1 oligosaccharide flippase family protein [Shewanella insulae]
MFNNIVKYLIGEGLAKVIPFLMTLYVAKFLAPKEYGQYSLIITYFEIIFIITSFNIQATTRIDYFKLRRANFFRLKNSHFFLSVLLTLCIFPLLMLFTSIDVLILVFLLVSTLLRTFSTFALAFFQCSKRVGQYILCNLIYVISLCSFIYVFLHLGMSVNSWVFAVLIASIMQCAISIYFLGVNNLRQIFINKISLKVLKVVLGAGLVFMPQALGWWLKSGAERIIISDSLGDEILGYYSLAFQFSSVVLIATTAINLVLVPEINKCLVDKSFEKLFKILSVSSIIFVICSMLLPYISNMIIDNYFGLEYSVSKDYLFLLSFSVALQSVMMILINVLYFEGESTLVAKTIFVSFSIQTCILYLFVDHVDITGVIYISVFSNVVVLSIIVSRVFFIFKNNSFNFNRMRVQ